MILKFFLILTLFAITVLSHITDANFYHLTRPNKRHNELRSACKHSSDCHHLHVHGARPTCEKGKCTFGWYYFFELPKRYPLLIIYPYS